jgi:hypothetical protein
LWCVLPPRPRPGRCPRVGGRAPVHE